MGVCGSGLRYHAPLSKLVPKPPRSESETELQRSHDKGPQRSDENSDSFRPGESQGQASDLGGTDV